MPELSVEYHAGGLCLPNLGLWLDAREPRLGPERVFVSHAHSDHTAQHREIIATRATARLMQERIGGQPETHRLEFNAPASFTWGGTGFRVTLLPAGHVLGSAMIRVEAGGKSLLYTGDFKLRPGLSAEDCQPVEADVLVMETTYGRPQYRFPPTPDILQGIIRFCRETINDQKTPVLLGYSLGKCQELLRGLGNAGFTLMLQNDAYRLTRVYEELGRSFPPFERYDRETARGKVLVCPPNAAAGMLARQLGEVRFAVITGWAVDPSCRFRYRADAAFPLSDHADYPDLLRMVERVQPKKIYTLHGFASDFAQTLRQLGHDAQSLSQPEQLALPLAAIASDPAPKKPRLPDPSPGAFREDLQTPASAFLGFAEVCTRIGATSKKLEKAALLAHFLKDLPPDTLGPVSIWFTGLPFAPVENKVLQLGWAIIRDALCGVAEIDHDTFGQIYLKHSDLGEAAHEILDRAIPFNPALDIVQVQAAFNHLHAARGPLAKLPILGNLLRSATPLEARSIIKILTGDLRIGLKEGLVEEAIAAAFGHSLEAVRGANLLLGNISETARLAKRNLLHTASMVPFRPIKYNLASPEETAATVWKRVQEWPDGPHNVPLVPCPPEAAPLENLHDTLPAGQESPAASPSAWVEDKYDGVRSQLHKSGSRVALYSRDLKEITGAFQELADAARSMPRDFVLDGEIIAAHDQQILPFSELQKRLGRKENDLFLKEEIPARFVAFDLLWADNETLLNRPLMERRALLEALAPLPPGFALSHLLQVTSSGQIEEAFAAARARGHEGLMVKDPQSPYLPGRRGLTWLKFKRALATLDCVVVGAEYGHGKRKAVLSDYTFAVRDDATGQLRVIGKAFSGLTDVEIDRLTRHFLNSKLRQHGRYLDVKPEIVLEVAFDAVQNSNRHDSGLALRFPRIVRVRTDKSPAEADTLATARSLVKSTSKGK